MQIVPARLSGLATKHLRKKLCDMNVANGIVGLTGVSVNVFRDASALYAAGDDIAMSFNLREDSGGL